MKFILHAMLIAMSMLLLAGCSEQNDEAEQPAPHTGNPAIEADKSPEPNIATRVLAVDEKIYYVTSQRLNVRSSAEIRDDNLVGFLSLNNQVRILNDVVGTPFVQIAVVESPEKLTPAAEYYIARDYLSHTKNQARAQEPSSRFFMIQNVATEKLRVYEKMCDDGSCAHKMVLEADIAVGEKTKDRERMTVLGSFNVSDWSKFYQDGGGLYPSWYDPNYPAVPKPGSGVMAWASHKVLPNKTAAVRGAFGWFTARVGPNAHNQWTHGTIGWGIDKKKFIDATRGFWANLFTDPRSHGCSRTDNETIAFVRHLIAVKAPVLKVYALEALGDPQLSRYPDKIKTWDYILTKSGVRVDGEKADRAEVLAGRTPSSQWLEQGTYSADVHPDVENFKEGKSDAKSGKNGNVYSLKKGAMHGYFLVDEGRLVSYEHPASLGVGGYGRTSFPAFVVAKISSSVTAP